MVYWPKKSTYDELFLVYFSAVYSKGPDGFVPAHDVDLQLPFSSRKTPKCKSPQMRAHNALVQDPIWVLHKALTCADLDLCDSKRRLPLVGDFSPFSEEAILKVEHWWKFFCWLQISMSILIFCLMFPPMYIHIWVDLRAVNALKKSLRRRKNCFNRQRAVRILQVHSDVCFWVFVVT